MVAGDIGWGEFPVGSRYDTLGGGGAEMRAVILPVPLGSCSLIPASCVCTLLLDTVFFCFRFVVPRLSDRRWRTGGVHQNRRTGEEEGGTSYRLPAF
jgi:hypothetical protein